MWAAVAKAVTTALGFLRDFFVYRAGKDRAVATQAKAEADAVEKQREIRRDCARLSDPEYEQRLRDEGF